MTFSHRVCKLVPISLIGLPVDAQFGLLQTSRITEAFKNVDCRRNIPERIGLLEEKHAAIGSLP